MDTSPSPALSSHRCEALHDRFAQSVAALGGGGDAQRPFAALIARYQEAARAYHTLVHISDCLDELDRRCAAAPPLGPDQIALITLALLYHDAIYDTRNSDSETRSAALAEHDLIALGIPQAVAARVGTLVRTTQTHAPAAEDPAAACLCDIDLAILGSEPARYEAFERAIRTEYSWVPEPLYRSGRRAVLDRFLSRARLYATDYFYARYEAQARTNLTRALAALADASPGG